VEYRILGPLAVLRHGDEVTLGGLRQRAVLAVLLLAGGRTVDTDRLIEQVWGDDAPPKPLASLRSYITNLRRLLDDSAIVRDSSGYRIATAGAAVDAHEFARLVGDGRTVLDGGDPASARDTFANALALWRGSPLSDFRDHHFAMSEIHRLEALRIDAVEGYYDAALRLGADSVLVAGLESEVVTNPLREKLWWQLMLAMYRGGRRTDALRAYARAAAVLDTELGVTPGTALERLAADIRNESAALDWVRPAPTHKLRPDRRAGELFGRATELRRLRAALAAAVDGHGGVVIVSGDSGMGKTALAQQVATRAGHLGMATAWAGHAPGAHRPPSWAWAHALRELAGQLPTGARSGVHAALPDWWTVAAADASEGDAESGHRFDVAQATATALSELVSRRPALIVIDDLQRADRFTLDVLEFVAACGRLLPLLILATWQEDAAESALGSDQFERLRERTDVDVVTLRGLSLDATADVVADLAGTAPSRDAAVDVHARTGGNPFFVRELVHLLMDNGGVDAAVGDRDVPAAVLGILRKRLSQLPSSGRAVLDVAAVLGTDVTTDRLAAVLDSSTSAIVEALGPARRFGLVVDVRHQPNTLRFSHGLVRDAIAGELTERARAAVHADIARSFARQYGDVASQDARDGAEHAWRADTALEPGPALELLDRARADAWARSAYREVAELDRRALEVCARLPAEATRSDREIDLQLQLASVEAVVNGRSSARVLADMKSAADAVPSTAAVAMGCLEACGTGRYHDAGVLSDSLVEFFDATGDPIAGAAGHYIRALTAFMRGTPDVATASVRTLHATVPPVDATLFGALASFEVLAYGVAAHAAGVRGDIDHARSVLATGIDVGSRNDDAFATAVLRTADIQLSAMLGDADGLDERAEPVVEELTALGIDQFIGGAKVIRAWALAAAGVDTVDEMTAALELHGRGGRRIFTPLYLGLLSDALAAHRDVASAHDALARAEAVAAATGERVWDAQLSARRLRLVARARAADAVQLTT
jgi:DNA-binding SARP family transcriptional activator